MSETVVEDEDAPQCRICFGGEEDGRLFSPCLCRGSMAMVHVKCLNSWRNASQNTRSFFQCDQCGYKYSTERTEYAKWLEAPELATSISAALIALGTGTVGFFARWASLLLASLLHRVSGTMELLPAVLRGVSWVQQAEKALETLGSQQCKAVGGDYSGPGMHHSGCPMQIEVAFYRAVNWLPEWRKRSCPAWLMSRLWLRDSLDMLVGGVVLVGVVAWAISIAVKLRHDFRRAMEHLGPSVLMMFVSHGSNAFRIVVACGLAYAFFTLQEATRRGCRTVLMTWGERVLAVHQHGTDASRAD